MKNIDLDFLIYYSAKINQELPKTWLFFNEIKNIVKKLWKMACFCEIYEIWEKTYEGLEVGLCFLNSGSISVTK